MSHPIRKYNVGGLVVAAKSRLYIKHQTLKTNENEPPNMLCSRQEHTDDN